MSYLVFIIANTDLLTFIRANISYSLRCLINDYDATGPAADIKAGPPLHGFTRCLGQIVEE